MRKKAHFERNPRSVIVNVKAPVTHVAITERAYQDWKPVASQIISDVQTDTPEPQPVVVSTPSAHRQHTVSTPEPAKMPIGAHHNRRFLNGIEATLKLSGSWETPLTIYHQHYNKYDLANARDVEIGLEILAKADAIESKETDGGKQYLLLTTEFETVLNRCQVSKYHLAEVTGIDEAVMCEYCKGVMISAADAQTIADTLNLDVSALDGMREAPKQSLQSLLSEVDAIMQKAVC